MEVGRRVEFLRRIVRAATPRLNAMLPSIVPLILVLGGVLGAVGSALTASNSPWPFWISLTAIAAGLFDAAYLEWDRWAPRARPRLTVNREDDGEGVALLVQNEDAVATFRASVIAITGQSGSDLTYSVGAPTGFPWELGWGTDQQRDVRVVRGEEVRLSVVRFDHAAAAQLYGGHRRRQGNPYIFIFPGPAGDHYLDESKPEANTVFEVHVRIVRSDPEGFLEQTVTIQFPQHPGFWQAMYVPGG